MKSDSGGSPSNHPPLQSQSRRLHSQSPGRNTSLPIVDYLTGVVFRCKGFFLHIWRVVISASLLLLLLMMYWTSIFACHLPMQSYQSRTLLTPNDVVCSWQEVTTLSLEVCMSMEVREERVDGEWRVEEREEKVDQINTTVGIRSDQLPYLS